MNKLIEEFIENKEYEKATIALDLELQKQPESEELSQMKFSLLVEQMKTEEALEFGLKYVEKYKNLSLMTAISAVMLMQGKLEESISLAKEILALEMDYLDAEMIIINAKYLIDSTDLSVLERLKELHAQYPANIQVLISYLLFAKSFGYETLYLKLLEELRDFNSAVAEMIDNSTLENLVSDQVKLALTKVSA